MAAAILARVPAELDALTERRRRRRRASRLGFTVEQPRGRRTFAIEFGNEALVDSLPGVPGGSGFVGTFDREEAVEDETIDFFASGHALVEGVLAHYDDGEQGRAARLEVELGSTHGDGIVAVYKGDATLDVIALDADGRERPEWAAAFLTRSADHTPNVGGDHGRPRLGRVGPDSSPQRFRPHGRSKRSRPLRSGRELLGGHELVRERPSAARTSP